MLHADPCTPCIAARQKKASGRQRSGIKKAAGCAAAM